MVKQNKAAALYFTGAPGDLAALPRSHFMRALGPGKGAWARHVATYYDTPNGALAQAGLVLCLSEEEGARQQAVHDQPNTGVARIREIYETVLATDNLFPVKTNNTKADAIIQPVKDQLRPVMRSCVDRWSMLARMGKADIGVTVDLGRVEVFSGPDGARDAPLACVALWLIDGAPAELFNLARLLAHNAPLRLGARTRLDVARAAARGAMYRPLKRRKHKPAPDQTAGDVLQAALAGVADDIISIQPRIIEARAGDGVQKMRVALRRLRVIERVIRPHLGRRDLSDLAAAARLFGRRLGPARDWDVFLSESLATARYGYGDGGVARLQAKAEAMRAASWAEAVEAVAAPSFTQFAIDLTAAARLAPWRRRAGKALSQPAGEFGPYMLDRALRKTVKTAHRTAYDNPAARHALRIAVKKLRYRAQLFGGLYPKAARKDYMAALAALQQGFGAANDAMIAQRLADQAAAGAGDQAMRAAGFISGYQTAEAGAAVRMLEHQWAAFEKTPPFWRQ